MADRNWKERTLETAGEVWDKEDILEGKLSKVDHEVGPNKTIMYTLVKEDGSLVKVWGSTVLDDKLIGVPIGTYIKLEYEGKLKSKKGAQYHSYKVFIDEDSMPAQEDKIHEVNEDEEITLEDIPF